MYELGGKFMQWLVQWTTGHAVQVLALAGVISSWATQFTLTMYLSTLTGV